MILVIDETEEEEQEEEEIEEKEQPVIEESQEVLDDTPVTNEVDLPAPVVPVQSQPQPEPTMVLPPTQPTATQELPNMERTYLEQDDSFFTTPTFNEQRAFTDIVSSVQGTYDFLQDSHIESQSKLH